MFTYVQLEIKNDKYDDENEGERENNDGGRRARGEPRWEERNAAKSETRGRMNEAKTKEQKKEKEKKTRRRKEELLYLTFVFLVHQAMQSKTNSPIISMGISAGQQLESASVAHDGELSTNGRRKKREENPCLGGETI